MDFVEDMYKIFASTNNPTDRVRLIKNLYNKKYASKNTDETEKQWLFSKPLIESAVKYDFIINHIADCQSGSCNGGTHLFVHLDNKLNHNQELIILLLAVANIWGENIYVYRNFHCVALNDTITNCIHRNIERFSYNGNLLKDIEKACHYKASDIKNELIDQYYYHYLYINNLGYFSNSSNSNWGTWISIKLVIVW